MSIEIQSITIHIPWWLVVTISITIVSKVKPKRILKTIKDWIKDD